MKFALLVYETASEFAARSDPKRKEAYWAGWSGYTKAIKDAGVMVDGAGLQTPDNATILQLKGGKRQVQDGPFADSKEQLGGYYIIDVPNLDAALDWAARLPCATTGKVEVRPTLQRGN